MAAGTSMPALINANTGVRDLYVDGMLAAQETNNVAYHLAPFAHLCIGAKDSAPGNNFGFFSNRGDLRRAHL